MKTVYVNNLKMDASGETKHFQTHVYKTFLYFLARNLPQKFGAKFHHLGTPCAWETKAKIKDSFYNNFVLYGRRASQCQNCYLQKYC